MVVDGHAMGECDNKQDIVLYAECDSDGIHIKKYWVEDIKFEKMCIRDSGILCICRKNSQYL